jgi:hypothetical protein
MSTAPGTFQELSGHGELHIPGQPPVGVLYYILLLAPPEPPSSSKQMDRAGAISVATGHMTPLGDLDRPLDLTAQYALALADGRQISVNLVSNSREQFALYTFECAASDLV